jgi:Zn-dependent protease
MDLAGTARALAFALIPMILSLSVHEFAHAWSATKLGDTTAKDAGRLTLNPTAHIDPWGTLFIPALSVLMGGVAFIGWARPTPFRADRFRPGINRRLGAAIVAAAGPLSNLLLATLSIAALAGLARAHVPLTHTVQMEDELVHQPTAVASLLYSMFTLNIALAFFNLLPIPPLDGHRLLPPVFDPIVRPLARYGFAIIIVIFLLLPGVANTLFFGPLEHIRELMERLFGLG